MLGGCDYSFLALETANIWSSSFIFFHRKRIKNHILSQHIHCYCCSALRNAHNRISLFRVSDSCLQWSDFIPFRYRFAWKYFVWGWVGVPIICSWKLKITLEGCFVHAFPMLGAFLMAVSGLREEVLPHLGAVVPHIPAQCLPACPWLPTPGICRVCAVVQLFSPTICSTKGAGITCPSHASQPTMAAESPENVTSLGWQVGHNNLISCALGCLRPN